MILWRLFLVLTFACVISAFEGETGFDVGQILDHWFTPKYETCFGPNFVEQQMRQMEDAIAQCEMYHGEGGRQNYRSARPGFFKTYYFTPEGTPVRQTLYRKNFNNNNKEYIWDDMGTTKENVDNDPMSFLSGEGKGNAFNSMLSSFLSQPKLKKVNKDINITPGKTIASTFDADNMGVTRESAEEIVNVENFEQEKDEDELSNLFKSIFDLNASTNDDNVNIDLITEEDEKPLMGFGSLMESLFNNLGGQKKPASNLFMNIMKNMGDFAQSGGLEIQSLLNEILSDTEQKQEQSSLNPEQAQDDQQAQDLKKSTTSESIKSKDVMNNENNLDEDEFTGNMTKQVKMESSPEHENQETDAVSRRKRGIQYSYAMNPLYRQELALKKMKSSKAMPQCVLQKLGVIDGRMDLNFESIIEPSTTKRGSNFVVENNFGLKKDIELCYDIVQTFSSPTNMDVRSVKLMKLKKFLACKSLEMDKHCLWSLRLYGMKHY